MGWVCQAQSVDRRQGLGEVAIGSSWDSLTVPATQQVLINVSCYPLRQQCSQKALEARRTEGSRWLPSPRAQAGDPCLPWECVISLRRALGARPPAVDLGLGRSF